MRINKQLNIVMELTRDDGKIFVHSTPISREVFELYFLPISKAFAQIYSQGLRDVAGPRVAHLLIKQAAMNMNNWEGPQGVENGLFGEMIRLTNVITPDPNSPGWTTTPLYVAANTDLVDADEMAEIRGVLAFFTCASCMHQKQVLHGALRGLDLWETQVTSLTCMEYAASLPTWKQAETSPAPMVNTSSVPL